MTLAMVIMGSVYYLYVLSSRTYRVQDQVMRAMDQARFGMEQVRRDIAAAGFLGTPDSDADANVCTPKPVPGILGIAFEDCPGDAETCVANHLTNVLLAPGAVTMFGAYWGGGYSYSYVPQGSPLGTLPTEGWDPFLTQSVIGTTVQLRVPPEPGRFPTKEQFSDIFKPGRFLRIVTAEQYELYYPIASVDYNPPISSVPKIHLASAPPISTPPDYCGIQGFGVGLEVNSAGYVRYRLLDDNRTDASGNVTPGKIDLVREELDASMNVVNGTTMVIAEFAADLQFYDFAYDADLTAQTRPTLAIEPGFANAIDPGRAYNFGTTSSARPQRLRAVTVKLTMRTEDEDPDWPFVARTAANAPIDSYDVDAAMVGSARTVSLAARVPLRSFTVRNVP
jgi:hypothetical protein